jgi:hypothetical protein
MKQKLNKVVFMKQMPDLNDVAAFFEGVKDKKISDRVAQYFYLHDEKRRDFFSMIPEAEETLEPVPQHLSKKVLSLFASETEKKESLLSLTFIFLQNSIEFVKEFSDIGWVNVAGQQPVFSYRGENAGNETASWKQKQAIVVRRNCDRFDVTVCIERVSSAAVTFNVSVVDPIRNEYPSLRAGLFQGGQEMESSPLTDGKAIFHQIVMGNYSLRFWDKNGERIALQVSLKSGEETR